MHCDRRATAQWGYSGALPRHVHRRSFWLGQRSESCLLHILQVALDAAGELRGDVETHAGVDQIFHSTRAWPPRSPVRQPSTLIRKVSIRRPAP